MQGMNFGGREFQEKWTANICWEDACLPCPALIKRAVMVFSCRDFMNTTAGLSAALLNCDWHAIQRPGHCYRRADLLDTQHKTAPLYRQVRVFI